MRAHLKGASILVVDDCPDVCFVVAHLLRCCGATVTAVGSGECGLNAYERDRPQVVVTDLCMPGMTGFDLAERIKAHDRARGMEPAGVFAMTALGQAGLQKARNAGFVACFQKPLSARHLVEAIAGFLSTEARGS